MNMTHIVGGSGQESAVQDRIRDIAKVIAAETSPNMKNVHRDRLTRLNAKVAEIEVGGRTESQKGEIRDLIVDALNSAKSAMMNGVLPGGGVALYQASKILETGLPHLVQEESERLGVKVMEQALKQPIRCIIENKTGENCGYILEKIESEGNFFAGYDVKNGNLTL
jgi:chaperonin GroEL